MTFTKKNLLSNLRIQLDGISALQIFNLIRFGATVLIGILLAKSGLPTFEIAIYEAFLFFSNMVSFFAVGGGQNALLQFFPKLQSKQQKVALYNIWVLFLIGSIGAAAILLLGQNWLLGLTKFETPPPFLLIGLYLIFNTPSWLTPVYYLLLEKHKDIIFYGSLIFVAQIFVVLCPIWLGFTLKETFLGLILLAILKFFWSIFILFRHAIFHISKSLISQYLILAFPLVLHVLIGSSVEYIDGIIVTNNFEDDVFAIFRYGAKELPLTLLLVGALVMALIPEVSKNAEKGLEKIKIETNRLSAWLFPFSCILMFASPFLFPLFFNSDFKASATVFNVYLLVISSRILLPQVVLIAYQKNYYLVWSAIIEVTLNIILSIWWVKHYGIVGIAFASVIAYLVNKAIMIFFNWKLLKIKPQAYIDLHKYLIYNTLLFGSYFMSIKFI